jgi:ribosomal protein S3AE
MVLRKKFFSVRVPLLNSDVQALAFSVENLDGRIISYDLTRMLRGKNLLANLKINVKDGKAEAAFMSVEIIRSYIIRLMRSNISYIEDSFICSSKEGKIRIKPFLLTRKKVHRSVRTALRHKTKEFIIEYVSNKSFDEIFDSILRATLQKELSAKLKKIYPLSLCEIRAMKIVK